MTCRVYVGEYQDRITGAAATAYVVIDENGRLVKAMAQKVKTNKGLSLQAVKLAVQGLCYLHGMDEAMLCIRTRVYALCAVYAQPYQELFGAESLPIRHRADITRGRTLSASNDRYHAEHHEDARLLARACGARRGGLRGLTADGLRTDTEGNLRVHLREKGGKERDALVLPDYADRVRKIFAKYSAKPSNSKYLLPLTALPKDMPLHYLRAQYAQDLYRYFAERGTATGNMYYCRAERKGQAYDKGILLAVSQQMGHSRCDVVVSHYLY